MAVANAPSAFPMTVFSDADPDGVVLRKLTQPINAPRPEDRGLGYSDDDAHRLYTEVTSLVDDSGRSQFFDSPPGEGDLIGEDYEDRRVFGLFRSACGEQPWCERVLVTNGGPFADRVNEQAPDLRSGRPAWIALSPRRFLQLIRRADI